MADIEERSDSSRYITDRALSVCCKEACSKAVVKDEPPKGAEGLTGHSHASPSHDGAARTARDGWGSQGGCVSQCVCVKRDALGSPDAVTPHRFLFRGGVIRS